MGLGGGGHSRLVFERNSQFTNHHMDLLWSLPFRGQLYALEGVIRELWSGYLYRTEFVRSAHLYSLAAHTVLINC